MFNWASAALGMATAEATETKRARCLREKIIAGSEVGCVKWRIGFDVEIGLTCGEWIVVGESWAVFMLTRDRVPGQPAL